MKNYIPKIVFNIYATVLGCLLFNATTAQNTTTIPSDAIVYSTLGKGWSNNSVNAVKFRKNSITTHKNTQFISYYDAEGYVVIGKRILGSLEWTTKKTRFKGNVKDAHNAISIAVDGSGFLHMSWDHHNTKLRYTRSTQPLGLELENPISMTNKQEDKVTYPGFYTMPNGNLLFFYRSGESGRGNLVINKYNVLSKKWTQIQNNLIDGKNDRSAYWQACVDVNGVIHISWVWRETWDVETNQDLGYAKSLDGGVTWQKSNGEKYHLPITKKTAEYAWHIPQNSNLINQTAMTTDANGCPYIVSYWNHNKIPQYQIVYFGDNGWQKMNTGFRKNPFILGGGGTKSIPISRPDILVNTTSNTPYIALLFRDEERGNKVSLAYANLKNNTTWKLLDLSTEAVDQWEPNYDVSLWKREKKLHIFYQKVTQIDGEGIADTNASLVKVLQVDAVTDIIQK